MVQRLMVQNLARRCIATTNSRYATRLQQLQLQPHRRQWMHSTTPLRSQVKGDTADTNKSNDRDITKSEDDDDDDDEKVPVWQNPLHHNNPELEKMFPEDFAPGEEMPLVPLPPMAKPGSNVQAPPHIHDLADEILSLSMLEMKQLVDKVANHFGFDPHAVAMGLGGGGGVGGVGAGADDASASAEQDAPVEKKTVFDLKLIGFDAKSKIKVIKEVRAIAGLGLKEAKEMVEGAPAIIKKDIKKEEAEELQKKLEEVGATIEIV